MSPKGLTEATNGRDNRQACEIPNRIGKNNMINYGSLEPPPACLCGLAGRGRRRGPGARVPGGLRWSARRRGRRVHGPRDSSGPGAAGPAGTAPRSRPSTGSPLFAGSPGSTRRGPGQGTAGARGGAGPRPPWAAWLGSEWQATTVENAGAGGRRQARDAHLDPLSSRSSRQEEVKAGGGGRAAVGAEPWPLGPAPGAHLALCPSCPAAVP